MRATKFLFWFLRFLCFSVASILLLFISGCSGCSKSGLRHQIEINRESSPVRSFKNDQISSNTVKMIKQNGVYQIPVDINGVPMYFIFDTGAGMISISATEAIFLFKQGKLSSDDVLGTTNFIDANGDVSEGTIIVLREVRIGTKTLTNVQASIVNNLEAPLLIGQSALEKFGTISIDYNQNEITFN